MNELKKLNQLNNELDKKLTKENNTIMTDMVCYIRAARLSTINQELIRQDLLEMALSAQERGELFSTVVGDEYKVFCDEIISNMPKMTLTERMIEILDIVLLCSSILIGISTLFSSDLARIVKELLKGGVNDFTISYSFSTVFLDLIIGIVSVGIVQYICKYSFELTRKSEKQKEESKKKRLLKRFLIGGSCGFLIGAGFVAVVKYASFPIFSVNLFIILAIAIVMYAAHKIINFQH